MLDRQLPNNKNKTQKTRNSTNSKTPNIPFLTPLTHIDPLAALRGLLYLAAQRRWEMRRGEQQKVEG